MWRPSLTTYLNKLIFWMVFYHWYDRGGDLHNCLCDILPLILTEVWSNELLISVTNDICLFIAFRSSLSWFPTVKLELTFCHQSMTFRHCWMIRLLKHRLWEVHRSSNHLRQKSSMFITFLLLFLDCLFSLSWVMSKLCWFFPFSNGFFSRRNSLVFF